MTYLELCQMTVRQSGTIQENPSGTPLPTTVVGQVGRLKLIVDFVREAYTDIQNAHRGWRWLNSEFIGDTVVQLSFYPDPPLTTWVDERTDAALEDRFSQWGFKDDGSDIGLSIYLAATGRSEEGPLRWLGWDRFYETQRRGQEAEGRPVFFSVRPDNKLILSPVPDAIYYVRGKYRKSAQTLAADADIPEMPVEFHTLIKDAALAYLEGFDEGPRIPLYRLRMLPNFSMLEAHQLPKTTWGGPLA